MADGFQTRLLKGLAVFLDADATLGATWNIAGAYTANQTGIFLRKVPQSPDRVITLSTYGIGDDPSLSDSQLAVQVRCRWGGQDPGPVDDLADAIFDLLDSKIAWTLSTGVMIVQCLRQSGPVSLGQDTNGRWSNSQNFYMTVHRPSTNRT